LRKAYLGCFANTLLSVDSLFIIYSLVKPNAAGLWTVCMCVCDCSYVSAMVPVKTMKEYELLQDLTVLFCETVDRSVSCYGFCLAWWEA